MLFAQRAHRHVMTGSHELGQHVDQICRSTVPRAAGVSEMVEQEKDVRQVSSFFFFANGCRVRSRLLGDRAREQSSAQRCKSQRENHVGKAVGGSLFFALSKIPYAVLALLLAEITHAS